MCCENDVLIYQTDKHAHQTPKNYGTQVLICLIV